MLCIVRKKEEKALHRRARDAIKANKPEDLRKLLSEDTFKRLISKTNGIVLSRRIITAIRYSHFECIEELVRAGANLGIESECFLVRHTIKVGGHLNILKLLLEHGADPDVDSESFRVFYHHNLYFSAKLGDLGCFRTLLLYGADPDYNCSGREFLQKTPHPKSVLGMCLERGYEAPFVKLLIDFGANMYLPDILTSPNDEAAKLLAREKAHPRSLMSQCRVTIRRLLRQIGKLRLIDHLEIPRQLVRYLQYHNELDGPEKMPRHAREFRLVFINKSLEQKAVIRQNY